MRGFLILCWLVVTALMFYSAFRFKAPEIEQDITERTLAAIEAQGAADIAVDVDGRHVNLRGLIADEAQRDAYLTAANETHGALGPIDGLMMKQATGGATYFRATRTGDVINLFGTVPSEDVKMELIAAAQETGASAVNSNLEVSGEDIAWISSAGLGVAQLSNLSDGQFSLSAAGSSISGTSASEDGFNTINAFTSAQAGMQNFVAQPDASDDLLSQITDLTGQLEARTNDVSRLEEQLGAAQQDIAAITDRANAAENGLSERDAQLALLTTQLATANDQRASEVNDLQMSLTSSNASLQARQDEALTAEIAYIDRISGLNARIAELEDANQDIGVGEQELRAQLETATGVNEEQQTQIAALQGSNAEQSQRIEDLTFERDELLAARATIEADATTLTSQNAQAQSQIDAMSATNDKLVAANEELAGANNDLNVTTSAQATRIDDLLASSKVLETERDDALAMLEAKSSEIDGLNSDVASLSNEIDALKSRPAPQATVETIAQCNDAARTLLAESPINFISNTARVVDGSRPLLERISGIALACVDAGVSVKIAGHTDNIGDAEFNQELSERRANAVRDFMIARGVFDKSLVAVGFGETQPIADNETPEGQAQNRRISFEWSLQ
jgi:outer membrane protein OmpA-like peptidoglycan-associated protein